MPGAVSEFIDDIEDLISSQDITPKERYASRKTVSVRSKKRETKDAEPVEKVVLESVVPGNLKEKIYTLKKDIEASYGRPLMLVVLRKLK